MMQPAHQGCSTVVIVDEVESPQRSTHIEWCAHPTADDLSQYAIVARVWKSLLDDVPVQIEGLVRFPGVMSATT